jgi:hypothetical protein
MAQLVAEVSDGGRGDAALIDLLDAYYAADPARARHDGYVRFARSGTHAPGDVLAELAAVLLGAALPRAVPSGPAEAAPDDGPGTRSEERPANAIGTLRVQTSAGEQTLEVRSIAEIVAAVNHGLEIAEDPRRLCSLTTGHDWCAYYVLDRDGFKQLESILSFDSSPT